MKEHNIKIVNVHYYIVSYNMLKNAIDQNKTVKN